MEKRKGILENSAWTVLLKQDPKTLHTFEKSETFRDMLPLIQSIKLVKGKYAEALLFATGLKTVGRLVLDPYSQALYSTERDDYNFLEKKKEEDIPSNEAVHILAENKYGKLPDITKMVEQRKSRIFKQG